MRIPGLPPEQTRQIAAKMCMPTGTFAFRLEATNILESDAGTGTIVALRSRKVVVKLERQQGVVLTFIHYSPGTGAREANLDLSSHTGETSATIFLIWSPEEIGLSVGVGKHGILSSEGDTSEREFFVTDDGAVLEFAPTAPEFLQLRVYRGDTVVGELPAIQSWRAVKIAAESLLEQCESNGTAKTVSANSVVTLVVTGFETYCKRRFVELAHEGHQPDYERIGAKFFSNREREEGVHAQLALRARSRRVSPLRLMIDERRINFQNMDNCKRAFRTGYGISFGLDLDIPPRTIADMRKIMQHRHEVVHSSPFSPMLDCELAACGDISMAENALAIFDDFISSLHQVSLTLDQRKK